MGRRQAEGRTFSLRDSRLLCSVAARPWLSEAFKRRVAWFWGLGFRALRFPVAPGAACSVTGFEYMCDTSRSCQSHQSSITASDSKASGMPLQNPSHTLRQALSTVCLGQVTHHTLKPIVAGCHECPAACLASIGAGGASSLWFHVGTHATFRVGVLQNGQADLNLASAHVELLKARRRRQVFQALLHSRSLGRNPLRECAKVHGVTSPEEAL